MNKYVGGCIGGKPRYAVYDPLSGKYSIGWTMIYDYRGNPIEWVPVWEDKVCKEKAKTNTI